MKWPSLVGLLAALVLAVPGGAAGQLMPTFLDPKEYASPSGHYALFVDPSDPYGRGGARYRLTRDGKDVWSGTRDFTLCDARVTDDGIVAGYAYSHGTADPFPVPSSVFRVVILDAAGKLRMNDVTPRQTSLMLHANSTPAVRGLIAHPGADRLWLRVRHPYDQRECFWAYRLSTGESLKVIRPDDVFAQADNVEWLGWAPVAGTPLTLLSCASYEPATERCHARFALLDPDGKPVWGQDFLDDYALPAEDGPARQVRMAILEHGAIVPTGCSRRFEIRLAATRKRIRYDVERGPEGAWRIAESGQVDDPEPAKPSPAAAIHMPELALRKLGRIELRDPVDEPASPLGQIHDFEFDAKGRILFVRDREPGQTPKFVLADQTGKTLSTFPLEGIKPRDGKNRFHVVAVGDDRFVVVSSRDRPGGYETGVWGVDGTTGGVFPLDGFDVGGLIYRVCPLPGGDLLFLGHYHWVKAFDAEGRPRPWSQPGLVHAPEDLTLTSKGEVAILDNFGNTVQVFDKDGRVLRRIDLKRAWGRAPVHLTAIAADIDGGFVVQDDAGTPPIVRMRADGSVRSQCDPHFPDGRKFGMPGGVRVAPDGRLWTCDRTAIFRLDDAGTVDRVLGETPDPGRLGAVAAVTVDHRGRIYAVDSRTGSIHVFDTAGRRQRVARTRPNDVGVPSMWDTVVTASDDGAVYLCVEKPGLFGGDHRYVYFGPDGSSLGIRTLGLDSIQEVWHAQADTGRRWVITYQKVYLVGPDGSILRTIGRGADNRWLRQPDEASVAPDGSLAVVSGRDVNLFSAGGDPIRTFEVPTGQESWPIIRVTHDARNIVVAVGDVIVVFDASGRPRGRFTQPPEPGQEVWWRPFLITDGRELLLYDGAKSIDRYALPEVP